MSPRWVVKYRMFEWTSKHQWILKVKIGDILTNLFLDTEIITTTTPNYWSLITAHRSGVFMANDQKDIHGNKMSLVLETIALLTVIPTKRHCLICYNLEVTLFITAVKDPIWPLASGGYDYRKLSTSHSVDLLLYTLFRRITCLLPR